MLGIVSGERGCRISHRYLYHSTDRGPISTTVDTIRNGPPSGARVVVLILSIGISCSMTKSQLYLNQTNVIITSPHGHTIDSV